MMQAKRKLTPIELRLAAVRDAMCERYICHASRQVKRLAQPLADSAGTDIRETFKRLADQPQIVVAK